MTRNEYIASILLEAADLLKEDDRQESLNEGAGLMILGSLGIAYTTMLLYFILTAVISDKRAKMKMKEMGKKWTELSCYKRIGNFIPDLTAIMRDAKHISYKEGVPEVIKQTITIVKSMNKQLNNVAKEVIHITNIEEYYNKKDQLLDRFNKIYSKTQSALKKLHTKIGDKWIEDSDIKPLILELLDNINKLLPSYEFDDDDGIWVDMNITDCSNKDWSDIGFFCEHIFNQSRIIIPQYLQSTKYIKIKMTD